MIYILGIETSCDETSAAVLGYEKNRIFVLTQVVNSQINLHSKFGGVVPEVAARQHIKNILPVINLALRQAKIKIEDITAVAATRGPGLAGALMVGWETAKTLAWLHKKPLYEVNHLLGHLWSFLLPPVGESNLINPSFPFISLIVSGGHTELVLVKSSNSYQVIGKTYDDAAGEAFDKVAKIMNLGYPGGPILSKRASLGNSKAFLFPRPMSKDKNFNFSFSGLKTAVLYKIRKLAELSDQQINDLSASFQAAVVEVLVDKTIRAALINQVQMVTVVGGVSANQNLRQVMTAAAKENSLLLRLPLMSYTGDNATMIALAGLMDYYLGKKNLAKKFLQFAIKPNLNI